MRRPELLTALVAAVALASGTARADMVVIDFRNGPPPSSLAQISTLTPSTGLDYNSAGMNVTINSPGDGVLINPQTIQAVCAKFEDLRLDSFAPGDGVEFAGVFGDPADGNSAGVDLYQGNSTVIKIVQEIGKQKTTLRRTVAQINTNQVRSVQIDWISGGPNQLDTIAIEIQYQDGAEIKRLSMNSFSGLKHDPNKTTAYRIQGLNITQDPMVTVGDLALSTEHAFVPEPASLVLSCVGVLGLLAFQKRGRRFGSPRQ